MLLASKAAKAGQVAIGDLVILEALAQNVQVVLGIGTRTGDRPNIYELRYVGRLQKPHEVFDREGGMSYGEEWIVQARGLLILDARSKRTGANTCSFLARLLKL